MSDTAVTTKSGRKIRINPKAAQMIIAGVVLALGGGTLDKLATSRTEEVKEVLANDTDMLDQHLTVIRERLAVIEGTLTETNTHPHLWSQWSDPQPLSGNYTTPVYVQQRHCKICGLTETHY